MNIKLYRLIFSDHYFSVPSNEHDKAFSAVETINLIALVEIALDPVDWTFLAIYNALKHCIYPAIDISLKQLNCSVFKSLPGVWLSPENT